MKRDSREASSRIVQKTSALSTVEWVKKADKCEKEVWDRLLNEYKCNLCFKSVCIFSVNSSL